MEGAVEPLPQSLTLGSVDLRGIEPLPPQCECGVIPLYYRPKGEGRMPRNATLLWALINSYFGNKPPVLKLIPEKQRENKGKE